MGKNCNYHFLLDKDRLYSLLAILQTKAMWLCLTTSEDFLVKNCEKQKKEKCILLHFQSQMSRLLTSQPKEPSQQC